MGAVQAVEAPLSGTIEQLAVSVGSEVTAGDLLAILESMKVHVRIEAQCSGIVQSIDVSAEQSVQRGQTLFTISESASHPALEPASDGNPISGRSASTGSHPSITDWQQRTALSLDLARHEAIGKRHAKGYRSARENLASLCDPDRFQEYGQLAVAAQRGRQHYDTLKLTTAADGVITGIGRVNQHSTALIINDYSVLAGTQGFYHHQKIDRMLEVARRRKLPVIMFTEGGGGRPGDTDVLTVNSGLQCRSFSTWASLAGIVPRIAIANGYNFAGNAALFGAADITIATRSSWIGMAGPAMIAGGGLGHFKPTDIGPIEIQSGNGVVDILVEDEVQACQRAKQLLSMFQGPRSYNGDDALEDKQTSLQAALPENRRLTYDVRDILQTIADQNDFIELQPGFGGSVVTGFIRVHGKALGVMANDCCVLGGAIDVDAGQKAARFMSLCDEFDLPIVSFCDTPGFMVGPEHEERGAVRKLADMFRVGAQISTPFYAVVLRKCYGLGAQAMLGGSTQRPDYTLSWPMGEFGPMGLEGAVTLGFRKELEACQTEQARSDLFDTLLAEQYQRGQAIEVASTLEIDAVIDPANTRSELAALLA